MPPVDLAVLRIGAVRAALVRRRARRASRSARRSALAGSLSTDESAGFVNGLLGRLLQLKPSLAV